MIDVAPSPFSKVMIVVTVAATAAMGYAIWRLSRLAWETRLIAPLESAAVALLGLALVAVPIVAWLFHPVRYGVCGGELRVVRPVGPLRISLAEIEDARRAAPEELARSLRVFGVGGYLGFYGKFWSPKLGFYTMSVRSLRNPVLIRTVRRRYVLSPEDPDALVAMVIEQKAAGSRSRTR